ncbi:hypothetical protein [Micavibrio aeruginosavorus]|uniref:hypothetical protein n=1 Tax=Micavibrio aeruginosavorus TaxID=349221 RepID=UPI003F4A92AC
MGTIQKNIAFSFLVAGCFLTGFGLSAPAFADQSPVKTYTEDKKSYVFTPKAEESATVTVDVYSRLGSSIDLTAPPNEERKGTVRAKVECRGDGQWNVIPSSMVGNCYDAYEYTYPEVHATDLSALLARVRSAGYTPSYTQIDTRGGQAIYKVTYPIPAQPLTADLVNPQIYTKCTGTAIKGLTGTSGKAVKQHCVFDNSTTSGIIGVNPDPSGPNDDMFRIKSDTSAFLEYVDRGAITDSNRLKYISRDKGDSRDLMMPAGPPESFADWDGFIQNKPTVLSTVESACYPVNLSFCQPRPAKMPPAPGYCGAAQNGYYPDVATINALSYGRCYVGTPTAVTLSADKKTFNWRCQSDPIGAAPDTMCSANMVIDGQCGPANGRTFTDASQVNTAGLCKFGTASRSASGAGSWSWTCKATGEGGKSPNCMASAKATMETCNAMSTEGAMVLVQDLSGSYWDDLPNLKNNMTAVLNDPDFRGWQVGLTSYTDFPSCMGCTPGDWSYRRELNLHDVSTSKAAILNEIGSWSAWNGGDWEESQYYAISRTLTDFTGQTSRPLNIVLATDAISHHHVAPATLAAQLKAANANLIVLATEFYFPGVPSPSAFYSNFIRSYGVKGVVVNLASDSSNFKTALKAGLTNSYCSDPANLKGCGPLDGISCSDSSLGSTCKSGQTIVPQGSFTYSVGGGKRTVYQCREQALFFYREDTL